MLAVKDSEAARGRTDEIIIAVQRAVASKDVRVESRFTNHDSRNFGSNHESRLTNHGYSVGRASKLTKSPLASVTRTSATTALGGPRRAQAIIVSTAPGAPWTTASTVPSRQLRTQ